MSGKGLLRQPKYAALLAQEYPRFSDAEYERRRRLLGEVMRRHGCDHLLVCGEQRAGSGVQWLTGWPITTEAFVIFNPGERERMFMEWYNHLPLARRIACDADVRWGEHRGVQKTLAELKRSGARRVGIMGMLGFAKHRALAEHFDCVDLNRDYVRLRLVKSEEEIDWMKIGAAFSDLGQAALAGHLRVGMSERELGNIVERAWVGLGGGTVIHFMGVTPMANPSICVPPQHHSSRRVQAGDVVFTEFTAHFWDYPGQVLRSYTVAADPTPLFRRLYDTAEAAFDAVCKVLRHGASMQNIVDAAGVIEDAGFTVFDDLLHGFGGGYFPPVLGTKSRPAGPLPEMTLEENMTVVVQPNVITPDEKAGVQVGELVRITREGIERLHAAPRGFLRLG